MKLSKSPVSLGLALLALSANSVVKAEDSGWYGGVNIGQSMANIDNESITSSLAGGGFTTTSIDDNNRDTGYKLFGGYQFNDYFALEGGYFDLGEFGFTARTVPAGVLNGNIKLSGLNLDAVGILPISERFSLFGRAGMNYAHARDSFNSSGFIHVLNPSPSKNDTNYKAGFGLEYAFSRSLAMRVEAERYRIDDAVNNMGDVDLISLGLVYRFVEKKSAPPVRRVERVVTVPIIAKTQEYCGVLDIQFDIKENKVSAADTEKLDALATFMIKYPKTTAIIEGHTDDVGEEEFNLRLSQQRADSVVQFLVNKHHIDAGRLRAIGYGETRPLVYNSTSKGQKTNRRIDVVIACVDDIAGLKVKPTKLTLAMNIEFDPSSHEIKQKYYNGLLHVAKYMKAHPLVTANVDGYADRVLGSGITRTKVDPARSMEISRKRAQSVVNFLSDNLGVERNRLMLVPHGQTNRVTYGTTLDGQQENRRVNIILIYPN